MRITPFLRLVALLATLATFAHAASCLVHCPHAGIDDPDSSFYCENGCGTPCPSCTTSGQAAGNLYGNNLYGSACHSVTGTTTPSGPNSFNSCCDCSMVNGFSNGWLDDCCRVDCAQCQVPSCPANKVTCLADCVPQANSDYSNCCYCDCDDGNSCTVDSFQAEPGATLLPNSTTEWTVYGTCLHEPLCVSTPCQNRTCVPGSSPYCIDQDLVGSCPPAGDECIEGFCEFGACTSASTPVDCDDGNPCTVDSCDSATGCSNVVAADGTSCSLQCPGASSAPANGICLDGTCGCDDGNQCTEDTCVPGGDCGHEIRTGLNCTRPAATLCEPAICSATAICQLVPVECDDDNECTEDTCNEATGECAFVLVAEGTECDDGLSCTTDDACSAAECTGVSTCDEGETCTEGGCDAPLDTEDEEELQLVGLAVAAGGVIGGLGLLLCGVAAVMSVASRGAQPSAAATTAVPSKAESAPEKSDTPDYSRDTQELNHLGVGGATGAGKPKRPRSPRRQGSRSPNRGGKRSPNRGGRSPNRSANRSANKRKSPARQNRRQ